MTDATEMLARVEKMLEYRVGKPMSDFLNVAEALDALLHHETRAGTIPRHGWNWFSPEDYERLCKAAYTPTMSRTINHPLLPQALAMIERCSTGTDFTHLVAELLIQASAELNRLQKLVLDAAALQMKPMFWPKEEPPR